MSSAPPSDFFLLPLESGAADTRPGDRSSGERLPGETLLPFSSEQLNRDFGGWRSSGNSPFWFVGDEPNDLLRVLSDLTQLDFLSGPVVLYGPSQTGKTVLADALAKRWARSLYFRSRLFARSQAGSESQVSAEAMTAPAVDTESVPLVRSKAICLSAFDWSCQLQEALDTNSLPSFHNRFLQAGALMIDDLQQLQNAPFSQGQLVLLIDRLEEAGIPVVITLNQPPRQVSGLRPDLISRMLGGLVLPVSLPGRAARQKLAQDWAREFALNLTPAGLGWLLNLPQTNSYSGLLGTLRTLRHASPVESSAAWGPVELQNLLCLPLDEAKQTWPRLIIATVAEHFELSVDLLTGSSRRQTPVQARGLAMTLIRALCQHSLAELGSLFANRDHSTVLNALESTEKRFANDNHFQVVVAQLLAKLQQIASLHRLPLSLESLPVWFKTNHDEPNE
jgi:DNA replication protein DnaC